MAGGVARIGLALVGAALIVWFAGWLDGSVLVEAQHQAGLTFDPTATTLWFALGYLVTAVGVLAVVGLAWWSRSILVSVAYILGGAFLTLLDVITWRLAAGVNDTPPVLPEPIANAVSHIEFWITGPVAIAKPIGAAMLVAGIAVLAWRWRQRPSGRSAAAAPGSISAPG